MIITCLSPKYSADFNGCKEQSLLLTSAQAIDLQQLQQSQDESLTEWQYSKQHSNNKVICP